MARKRSSRSGKNAGFWKTPQTPRQGWFAWFAQETARLAGRPGTFFAAIVLLTVWFALGSLLGDSAFWHQGVNTTASIVTLLMVLLIQNTQNRDTLALQTKLAEIILHLRGTHRELADAEDLPDEELEALHRQYQRRAENRQRRRRKQKSRAK